MVDGQALDPTTFAEYNADGVWVPKEVTGFTYGTNGFYLDFSDPASIGADRSGNGNNFTPTGFELTDTSNPLYDWMADSPTNNHATLNPLCQANPGRYDTIISGLLQYKDDNEKLSTIVVDTDLGGKYYCELTTVSNPGTGTVMLGIFNHDVTPWRDGAGRGDTSASWVYRSDARKRHSNSTVNYGSNWFANGNTVSMLLDLDNRTLSFYTNGTNNGAAYTGLPDGRYTVSVGAFDGTFSAALNGGSQPFKHTPPAGFEPLSTAGLATPPLPATITGTFAGNGSSDGPFVYTGCVPGRIQYGSVDVLYQNRLSQSNVDFLSNGFKVRSTTSNSGTVSYTVTTTHSGGEYNGKKVPFGGAGVSPAPAVSN